MKGLKDILESILDRGNVRNVGNNINDYYIPEIEDFLKKNYKGNFKISKTPNQDGKFVVDSNTNVILKNYNIEQLTNDLFVFGKIDGNFECVGDRFTSLEGAPETVTKNFICTCPALTSLKGCPYVWGHFVCKGTGITSLEGVQKRISGNFDCSENNNLIDLKGSPKSILGDFKCDYCKNLVALNSDIDYVGGDCSIVACRSLQSLEGSPKEVKGRFMVYYCDNIKSIKGCPKKVASFGICSSGNPTDITKENINKICDVKYYIDLR
jgi:hypothetical protein